MEDERKEDPTLFDQLLSKYVGVWLWTILFGTTTGVLYSFLTFRYERWGSIGVVLAVPAMLALILALLSWQQLYSGLHTYLLPKFLATKPDDELDPKRFAYTLQRSFFYFILAAALRALSSIFEILLVSGGM